jgi:hypothetical protein
VPGILTTKTNIRHKSGRTDACLRDDTGALEPAQVSKSQVISLPVMHLLHLHNLMCTDGAESSPFKLSVALGLSFYHSKWHQWLVLIGFTWRLTHLSPPRNLAGLDHRDAAATAPAPLKAALLVMTTSTGYFHSMNCFHPEKGISIISSRGYISLYTPICEFPSKVFAHIRYDDQTQ